MTPESLEQSARQFDKLKAKTPTELADWARENVPALIDQVRASLGGLPSEGVQALWALFPGVPAEDVPQLAADDIRATRAERAKASGSAVEGDQMYRKGLSDQELLATTDAAIWGGEFCRIVRFNHGVALDQGWVIGWFANAFEAARPKESPELAMAWPGASMWADALRPFAALGAPNTIATIERIASAAGVDWLESQPLIAVRDENGETIVAISRDAARHAHDVIETHDAGVGG